VNAVEPPVQLSTARRATIWALIVLASLIALLAAVSMWLDRQLLDDNGWKNASAKVIQQPQVRDALSVYVVNQLYDNVDVAGELQSRLPKNLKQFAAPVADAVRGPAATGMALILEQSRVQTLFVNASSQAHNTLVNILENKTGYGVSTGNGTVMLDLSTLVNDLGGQLGVPKDALAKLPPDVGQITVMSSNQLSLAQFAVNTIRVLSVWLLVVVLAMYALAVYLARGVRRVTLRRVAWAIVLVGLLVLVIKKLAGNYVIDALASPAYRGVAHRVWLIVTTSLGGIGWALILYGLVGVAGVTLAGPTKPARNLRRLLAPAFADHQGAVWGVVGFAFLLLLLWGGTHALRTVWGSLLLASLIAAGVYALRRQTLAEVAAGGEPLSWRLPRLSITTAPRDRDP
jgi:hypothetical protein